MRAIELTVPSERTQALLSELSAISPVRLRLHPGASLEPPGDHIVLEVSNEQLRDVMRIADRHGLGDPSGVSMTTSVPLSVVSPSHLKLTREGGGTTWEELELSLGQESTMTGDRVVVMVLAGAIAAAGILSGAVHVVVGAMVIAPGFQPFARVVLGVINRSSALREGLVDAGRGYAALMVGAAVLALLSRAFDVGVLESGALGYQQPDLLVAYWSSISWPGVLVGVVAAVCGGVLLSINLTVLTAGVMVALALVPSTALVSIALVTGDPPLALDALVRLLVEVVLVLVGTAVVLGAKRHIDRRRTSD